VPSSKQLPQGGVASIDATELRTKQTWLAAFRLVATSVLLVVLAARKWVTPEAELGGAETVGFSVVAAVYLLTLVYAVALRKGVAGPRTVYAQILSDVLLASALVFITGVADSPFTFVYSVAVVSAAILLYQRGAIVAAIASTLAFGGLVLIARAGIAGATLDVPMSRVAFQLSSNAIAQLLIAILASYLSRQVAMAGGRVRARDVRIEQLVGLQNMIVAAMPSGLITCSGTGRVTYINPAGEHILGLIAGAWPADVEELLPGVNQLRPGTRRAELPVITPGGERVLGLAVTPLDAIAGSMLIVFQDLTELRRAEEQLRTADHLASLGRLSAQLAHEIRNPLASMRGAAQLLSDEAAATATTERLSNILMREADRLSTLVEDFLKFARPPPPKLEPVDLGRLISETVEMLRADPMARGVVLEDSPARVMGKGDADQLRQVLINLVRNALVAVGPGGRVKVTVEEREGRPQIRVWDSAGKISPADLPRIFEPFFTTREGGTGLGLTTAHTIVNGHGGRISVSSSPVSGTEFVVALQPETEARA
jgi:two-component system sensor histidine kinase PilS (NtrC family)